MKEALTRIGIFYDGNFFNVVSNYYAFRHHRKSRISISGLHEFVRRRVAHEEHVDARLCQVVDVHYFRGRFSADEASDAGKLYAERVFDDVLIREGITTHYLPMGQSGTEKGIDVWFALEAYELAIYKRFDVCVLVACDSDYVPLVRKLNALGTRVMVLGWDFDYEDSSGRTRTTKTSQALLSEVTYPVLVSSLIDDKTQRDTVKEIFLPPREMSRSAPGSPEANVKTMPAPARFSGRIQNLIFRESENKKFGFITPDSGGANVWFGAHDVADVSFDVLTKGQAVTYESTTNWSGPCARLVRVT